MFAQLQDKLFETFKKLRGHGKLTEENIRAAMEEIRLSLVDADVQYQVAKDFTAHVTEKAVGQAVLASITPEQQIVKFVYDELTALMGKENTSLVLTGKPPVPVLLAGLQGSGKTTTAAKLAKYLRKQRHNPYLVPMDLQRPAAIEQLTKLGKQVKADVFPTDITKGAVENAVAALEKARRFAHDVVIFDTAGRLHIDSELMAELKAVRDAVHPKETILVVDAMLGQESVNVAKTFDEAIGLTGVILTKLDGDARGGAALSIRAVTGKPVKFIGVGESTDALEPFHPDRVASRLLDKGDIKTLVEKASESLDQQKAQELEKKIRHNQFTIEDFRESLRQMKKLGNVEDTLNMIPGVGRLLKSQPGAMMRPPDKELIKIEAIINSMTPRERADDKLIDGNRRARIAKGSGTTVNDVNRFLLQYREMRKMMKDLTTKGPKQFMRGLAGRRPKA